MDIDHDEGFAVQRRVARVEDIPEDLPVRIAMPLPDGSDTRPALLTVRRQGRVVRASLEAHGSSESRALDVFVTVFGDVVVSLPSMVAPGTWPASTFPADHFAMA